MSDKRWTRDTFDVLLQDGTELLGVTVNYADRIQWAKYAAEVKETGTADWRVDTGGILWCALVRLGHLSPDYSWSKFRATVDLWERVSVDPVDPTAGDRGNG